MLTYFERTKDPDIERMFPRSVLTREQAIANFQASLLPDADSFGQTIWADGEYVGDIWCFCIDRSQQPNAMLSLCLFAKERWGQGIGSRAMQLFLPMVTERFRLQSIGAFVYSDNLPSLHLLQKNDFVVQERFVEDGRETPFDKNLFVQGTAFKQPERVPKADREPKTEEGGGSCPASPSRLWSTL